MPVWKDKKWEVIMHDQNNWNLGAINWNSPVWSNWLWGSLGFFSLKVSILNVVTHQCAWVIFKSSVCVCGVGWVGVGLRCLAQGETRACKEVENPPWTLHPAPAVDMHLRMPWWLLWCMSSATVTACFYLTLLQTSLTAATTSAERMAQCSQYVHITPYKPNTVCLFV